MRNYVIINGINSLTIQGLAINNLPPITKPMIRTQREEIDGRDGDIVTELGYSAYDKQMEIGLYGNFDIDAIIKYFTGEGTIVFSNEADKYYNFKILDQIDYEKLLKFKTATITFHCQPFKYPLEEEPEEAEITTITGTGESITLENVEEAPMKIVYKGNTLQNGEPTPDTPIPVQVVSGDNSIEICGKNFANIATGTETLNNYYYIPHELNFEITSDMVGKKMSYSFDLNVSSVSTSATGIYSMIGYGVSSLTNIIKQYLFSSISVGNYNIKIENFEITNDMVGKKLYTRYLGFSQPSTATYTYSNIQLEYGETSSTYTPYISQSYPINLPVENLYNKDNDNHLVAYIPASGTISYGANNYFVWVKINKNTKYTIKFTQVALSTSQYTDNIQIGLYENEPALNVTGTRIYTETRTSATQDYTYTYTFNSDNNNYVGIKVAESTRTNVTDTLATLQISEGEPTSKYYPYGTTPIEMCKIGTYQDKIDKSTGKNLTIKNIKGFFNAGDTRIAVDGDSESFVFYAEEGKTYTYSCQTTTNRGAVAKVDTLDIVNNTPISYARDLNGQKTFTSEFTGYCIIYANSSKNEAIKETFMINEGSTPLPYEPYGTSWYLKKEIGKVVLNGSESWQSENVNTKINYYINLSSALGSDTSITCISNYFTGATGQQSYESTTLTNIVGIGESKKIRIRGTTFATKSDFTTWLSTHNTEVYCVLEKPTYTLIEGELLNQLEAIKMSYEGQTNISQTNNDLPFELDASVTFLTPMEINNIGNIYAKPILTIEGTGNIGVVLNGIQILEIDLSNNGKITIDVPKLEAYNPDDDSLLNRLVTGDYMKLLINEGENKITFTGEVSGATLTNYIRWI